MDTNTKRKLTGKFIVIDGPDGCGKTKQIELLADFFKLNNITTVKTIDPGGTPISNQISRLLKYDAQGNMDVRTEVMLFMASRAQLITEVVGPALKAGSIVLCDRFISSTCAYQGSSGFPIEQIIKLGELATGGIWPNLTIIIDIPIEIGRERTGQKPYQKAKVNHKDAYQGYLFKNVIADRFDSRPLDYHRKTRKGFLRLPQYYPGIVKIIDGSGSIETIHNNIIDLIKEEHF